jgi:hypothetical protein
VEPLRLFHPTYARTAFGLPVDNLYSQFFADVYLNGLDQFVKHRLRCRHYLRYCDGCCRRTGMSCWTGGWCVGAWWPR